jgi:hypothetical protein
MKNPIKIAIQKWGTTDKIEIGRKKKEVTFKSNDWGEIPEVELKSETVKMPDLVKIEPGQWGQLDGLQPPNIIRQFDGINGLSSFAIKDTHATRNKNVTTSRYPALATRNGGAVLTSTLTTEIDGIGVRGTELHVITNGIWSKYVGGTWTQLKTGLNTTKKWSFVNFQGSFANNSLLVSNGVDAAQKYDGTTVSTLANAPALSNFITTHDNRVYLAAKSTVYFSALRKAEDWSTVNDSGSIVVETSDGLDITGLIAGSSRLTVFKQNSIHELFGNNPSNYQMKIVTDNLGSPTGNTAQVIDGVIYFLGNDAVYRYSGGSVPSSDFSLQVRDALSKINKAAADQSVSWQTGKKYYLAFPTGSNTNPDTVLEYDLEFNLWNTWSFPSPITAKGAVLSDITYIGCANGTLYKMDNSAITDNGTVIAWEWVSKPFTFSSLAAKSRWYRMWVVADIPTGATLNVHVSGDEDGENWTKVQGITANTTIQSKEIMIPTTLINQSNWVRIRLEGTGQTVVYEVSRQERVFPFGQN